VRHFELSIDRSRRVFCRAGAAGALLSLAACATSQRVVTPSAATQVPAFSTSPPDGNLPTGWRPFILRRDKGATRYRTVHAEGRTVLSARAEATSTAVQCEVNIDLDKTPWLQWQWRVDALVPGARIDDEARDDSPARLVLAFRAAAQRLTLGDLMFFEQIELFTGQRLPNTSLLYVWDPELPVGTVARYARTGRIRYFVVESGPARLGQWVTYRRNVLADFKAAFNEPPGPITSVGVLTDSDDMRSTAEALYGDISFVSDSV
jgi:Protein of unknown function (DUF3047)